MTCKMPSYRLHEKREEVIAYYTRLSNYECRSKVCFEATVYWQHGTIVLVVVEASTVRVLVIPT